MARSRRSSGTSLRGRVEKRARRRCEHCHAPQRVSGYPFHMEHIIPRAHGGSDAFHNRALSCATCNLAKGEKTLGTDHRTKVEVVLYNPRSQVWEEHFRWAKDRQTIVGRTPTGRATVATLDMNSALHLEARSLWFETGWLP